MNGFYEWAKAVVNNANPDLDGGIFNVVLNNINLTKLSSSTNEKAFSANVIVDKLFGQAVTVLSKRGYAAAIVCNVCWIILLLVGIILLWRLRYKSRPLHHTNGVKSSKKRTNYFKTKQNIYRKCKLVMLMCIFICMPLLILFCLMGIASTVELHVNFVQSYKHSNVSVLTPAKTLVPLKPSHVAINPRVQHALSSVKAYLDEFVEDSKLSSKPVIDSLVNATFAMQDKSSLEFAAELQQILGTDVINEDSEKILRLSIDTKAAFGEMVVINSQFQENTEKLALLKRDWGLTLSSEKPTDCPSECKEAFQKIIHDINVKRNLDIRPEHMSTLLNFLTKDDIEAKLGKGDRLAEKQRQETMEAVSKRIDIESSVRQQPMAQILKLKPMLEKTSLEIETMAPGKLNIVATSSAKVSNYILALNSFLWVLALCLIVFLCWTVYQYLTPSNDMSDICKRNVRTLGCIGVLIVLVFLLFAGLLFFVSGYAYTEGCRYFDYHRTKVSKDSADTKFALDIHINTFLNDNWATIEKMYEEEARKKNESAMPLPKVRNIISGLAKKCKDNVGILEAFDAIKTFDILSTYDDTFTKELLQVGKEVMIQSLRDLDIDKLITAKEEADLSQVGNLDMEFTFDKDEMKFFDTRMNSTLVDISWEEVKKVHNTALKYAKNPNNVQQIFTKMQDKVDNCNHLLRRMREQIKNHNNREKLDPIGKRATKNIKAFRKKMSENLEEVILAATKRYDEIVGAPSDKNAKALITEFGPQVMASFGRCKLLYNAFDDVNKGICGGIIGPLNGLWFCAGCIALFGTLLLAFSMIFLLRPKSVIKVTKNGTPTPDQGESTNLTAKDL